jgi:heme-degrading monooxygenase HmoA
MILEVAQIDIRAGEGPAFEKAVALGLETVVRASPGFISARLRRGIESPQRYLLLIEWRMLEDHTVGFRQSECFTQWRAIVGPFFAQPPRVEHFEQPADAAA